MRDRETTWHLVLWLTVSTYYNTIHLHSYMQSCDRQYHNKEEYHILLSLSLTFFLSLTSSLANFSLSCAFSFTIVLSQSLIYFLLVIFSFSLFSLSKFIYQSLSHFSLFLSCFYLSFITPFRH